MVLGLLEVELRIPDASSLKQKRMVIRSIKDKIRNKYNVSISEISHLSQSQQCRLGIAHISNEKPFSNQVLSKIVDFIELSKQVELVEYHLAFL